MTTQQSTSLRREQAARPYYNVIKKEAKKSFLYLCPLFCYSQHKSEAFRCTNCKPTCSVRPLHNLIHPVVFPAGEPAERDFHMQDFCRLGHRM